MRATFVDIQAGCSMKLTLVVGDQSNISQQRYNGRPWQLQDEADRPEPTGQEVASDT
jgi:hypothetical protein